MTVMSRDSRQGNLVRHPLDLAQCIRPSWPTPKGKKVAGKMQAVRFNKASSSRPSASKGGPESFQDALTFMFCAKEMATITSKSLSLNVVVSKKKVGEEVEEDEQMQMSVAGVQLPEFELSHLGLLLPAAVAAHGGLLLPAGAACACLPIMAPFRVPQVSPDSWMANKRALAFHRCVTLGVYVQGVFTLFKFAKGDLIGGVYGGIQTAMGAYAVTPDGVGFMPSYLMISGFNGVLGLVQVFQAFQGVPLHFIPISAVLPPVVGLLSCYWGWQFCREIRAIGAGMSGDGPQDTCWVKFMGGDIWPISALSPEIETRDRGGVHDAGESFTGGGGVSNRFSAFGGSGHRLGEAN